MPKKKKKREILTVVILIFVFALLYSLLSVIRHNRFNSFAYDLGIYDQVIWKYSRFKIPYSSIKEKKYFWRPLYSYFSPFSSSFLALGRRQSLTYLSSFLGKHLKPWLLFISQA